MHQYIRITIKLRNKVVKKVKTVVKKEIKKLSFSTSKIKIFNRLIVFFRKWILWIKMEGDTYGKNIL